MAAGGHREIQLTKGFVALVDAEDYEWLNSWSWCFSARYALRRAKGSDAAGPGSAILMHRAIMQPAPGLFVDHVNGDGLNNTRANLRICTRSQNAWNMGAVRQGKLKGAFPSRGGWQAIIRANRTRHYLGFFPTEEAAARAYDAAALRLHGEFARINFPEAQRG